MATSPQIKLDEDDFIDDETDVNNAVEEQESTTEESSTKETTEPEVAEPKEDAESDTKPPKSEAKDEDEPGEAEEPEAKAVPPTADRRITGLQSDISSLVNQRNELRNEVERLNAQAYAPQSTEDIMADTGQSYTDARITAMEQRQELEAYNNRIADAQLTLSTESERVLRDYPMFDPKSSSYIPEIASAAASLLQQQLQYDQNTGQITGSNLSPYQLYKTIADANQNAAVTNQAKGQLAANQQLANAEPQSSAVPKQPKEDPFLAGLLKGIDV